MASLIQCRGSISNPFRAAHSFQARLTLSIIYLKSSATKRHGFDDFNVQSQGLWPTSDGQYRYLDVLVDVCELVARQVLGFVKKTNMFV